jgi:aldehyde:ferredoxin oxidoreductase
LRINLSSRKVPQELVAEPTVKDFIGGKGLGVCYLCNKLTHGADPLGQAQRDMKLHDFNTFKQLVKQQIAHLNKFLDRYCEIWGWTPEGVPSPQKLNGLGLSHVAKDMAKLQNTQAI